MILKTNIDEVVKKLTNEHLSRLKLRTKIVFLYQLRLTLFHLK